MSDIEEGAYEEIKHIVEIRSNDSSSDDEERKSQTKQIAEVKSNSSSDDEGRKYDREENLYENSPSFDEPDKTSVKSRSNSSSSEGPGQKRSRASSRSSRSASPARSQSPRTISRDRSSSPKSRSSNRSASSRSKSPVPVAAPRAAIRASPPTQGQEPDSPRDKGFESHAAYKDAGQKVGIEIWRIEQFEPVRQPVESYGKFFTGDCYIILKTKTRPGRNRFDYALHFWIGAECSPDEAGAVAMRTVELDESVFGGAAVQHREVQAHESPLFLSYFKNNIRYMTGGTKSGFTHVDPNAKQKRLFQLKGKKNIRVAQVPCVCGSLNQGDTFVLEDGNDIYVWIGPLSTKKEKLAGVGYARLLRDEGKGGKARIEVVKDWANDTQFFRALGSRDRVIKAADEHDDEDTIRKLDQAVMLYKMTEKAIIDIGNRPLVKQMLTSDACFILDSGPTGMYLWTGKKCSNALKRSIWSKVTDFLDMRGYPFYLTVVRVVENGENALFKQYFKDWEDDDDDQEYSQSNVAEQDYTGAKGIDTKGMYRRGESVEDWMPDDGSGQVQVWRIQSREPVPIPEQAYGVFFGGDSYVILYTYGDRGSEKHIIYFWQGTKSSVDEKAAAALQTVAMDQKFGGKAVQIRVVQQKEPAHFVKIFNGKLVYFMGGHIGGFRSLRDYDGFDPRQSYMYQIKGTKEAIRAIQVTSRAASLNSNDVFVVDTEKKAYTWTGKYSSKTEGKLASKMLAHLAPDKKISKIDEGKESGIFWHSIGGEEKYYTGQRRQFKGLRMEPRLFHCSMDSGKFTVEEIVDFTQEDLVEDDVMLLDTYDEIMVWVGKNAREFEKKESYKTAYSYLSVDPSGRTPDNTLIVVIKMGFEPPQFTGCFLGWDNDKWSKGHTFEEMVEQLGHENDGVTLLQDVVEKYTSYYTYEELKRKHPPEGVDPKNKELYLTPDDFKKVFGMSNRKYKKLPEWKRINLKKQAALF